MNNRINRTLLIAAAMLGASSSPKAYDFDGSTGTFQVARTDGDGSANLSVFEGVNSATLSGTYYGATIVGRNVLPFASEEGTDLEGSVVKLGDIALGFFESEGLYAKDGGWLDIRGDLTLGASGDIFIRDGEITSNIYTQYYASGTLDEAGLLDIEAGILSVRYYFAQDMVALDDQTLGFRDGAVNSTRLILTGFGYAYGFDGEGGGLVLEPTEGIGALRSITGNNIQNGNISIVSDGGPVDGAVIGIDTGATLVINGNINGLNNVVSDGGAIVGFNAVGNATVNGRILAGISDVYKVGAGELLLTAANLFTGDVNVIEGSVRITNSGALSGTSGLTYVGPGASLVLDQANGLSLVDDIHIDGTGLVGVGGALHNKTGANVTTGNLWIDDSTESGADAAATAKVDASSSLTVAGLRSNGSYNTFTIDVGGAALTSGSFTVSGTTGEINDIIKNGTGLATFTTLTSDVENIFVNAGKVVVLGSESTALAPFDATSFDKWGAALIEIRGSHFYEDFDVREGTADLFGNVTNGINDGGDFDLGDNDEDTSGILNVESGATLTHVSAFDGNPNANTDGFDIVNNSALNVKRGGVVQLNGAEIDLDDNSTVSVAGTLSSTDAINANDNSTVTVLAGGVVNTNLDADSDADIVINAADVVNAYARGQVTGNAVISDDATLTVNGLLTGNVTVSDSGIVRGSGQVIGNLNQNNATIAPGNSPGILLVTGNYTNVGGLLDLELADTGVAGTAYDQLRVTGTIIVSNVLLVDYSTIRFIDFAGFEAEHGDVFQVIADGSGNARNTFDKFDLSATVTSAFDRVLFNHATGRAYGTGLVNNQNFSNYGKNRNQREIGRALWMEAIDYDKSGLGGELPQSFIDSAYDPVAAAAKNGRKAWILTRHDNVQGELSTDLGDAAVQVLTASSGATGLDSLSPEAYSGFGEIAVRLNRNIAQLGTTGRRTGDDGKWGFNFGYSGEQMTSDSTSDYTSYKTTSDTAYLTGDFALGSNVHLNLSVALDDGRVQARDFNGDTNTSAFGIGLSITPESKFVRFDIGASFSNTNFDAVRQGSYMSQDNQDANAVAARLTFLPKQASLNTVVKAGEPAAPKVTLTPYVGVSFASTSVDAFSEADVAGAQLNVDGFNRRSLVGEFGLNAEYALSEKTTLTGVFAYEHEFRDSGQTAMTAEFANDGVDDTDFTIHTDGFGANIFRLGVGVRQQLGDKASLGLSYDALFGGGLSSGQHIKADVSFRF
jgi:autotransporter-associated beta strand protein